MLDLVNTGAFSSMESSPGVTNAFDSIRLPKLKKLRITQEYPMKPLKQSTREKIEMVCSSFFSRNPFPPRLTVTGTDCDRYTKP